MIKSFADRETERLFRGRRSGSVPTDIRRRALAKLRVLDAASDVAELRTPAGNRLHKLGGDRAGQWAIAVNQQFRICFGFEGGDAYDVEITDYH